MTNAGNGGGDIFDVKKVRRLVELMEEHDLAEIDLRQADQRIRLRRGMDPQIRPGSGLPAARTQSPGKSRINADRLRKQQPRRPTAPRA